MTAYNFVTFRTAGGYKTDKAAFDALMQLTDPTLEVFFPAAQGLGQDKAYEIWTTTFVDSNTATRGNIQRGNVTLYGNGFDSVIRQPDDGSVVFMIQPPKGNPSVVQANIEMHDLLIDGCMGRESVGYNESNHLVRMCGVNKFTARRVLFRNAMGDGLFVGSAIYETGVNTDFTIENCIFESTGQSQRGRNATSITYCDKYTIQNCAFNSIGADHPGWGIGPGAVDIEPENSNAVVRSGKIYNCDFTNVNTSAVSLLNGKGATCNNVDVTNCRLQGAGRGFFDIQGHTQVLVYNNVCSNMSQSGNYMGWIRASTKTYILSNKFTNGRYIRISNTDNWSINNNEFRDCGAIEGIMLLQNIDPSTNNGDCVRGSFLSNDIYGGGAPGQLNVIYFVQVNGVRVQELNIKYNTIHTPSLISAVGYVTSSYDPKPQQNPLYTYVDPLDNYPSGFPEGSLIAKQA